MHGILRILASLIALIGFGWSQAQAAVGLQGCTAEVHQAANTTFSYTGVTVTAGASLALTVTVNFDISNVTVTPSVSSIVWDQAGANQSLTLVNAGQVSGTASNTETWAVVNPTAGASKTITVTTSASAPVFLSACVWTGVDQTGGATSFPHAAALGNSATVNVTSATGNIVLGAGASGGALSGITGTLIYNDSSNGLNMNAFSNQDAGAASVAIGSANTNVVVVGTDIKAAAGGAAIVCRGMLLGVGC